MKRILALSLGLAFSSIAAAQVTGLNSGKNDYRMTDCGLLANDVVLTLSANVTGAVNCNADEVFVAMSFCHTSGLVANRSAVVTTDASGTTTCTVADGEDCVETVSGASYPSASTQDGTVKSVFPGQNCSQANAIAVATSFNPPADEGEGTP